MRSLQKLLYLICETNLFRDTKITFRDHKITFRDPQITFCDHKRGRDP